MNVKRYNQEYYHSGDESTLDEAPDGEWVRWDEVEPLLIDRVAAQERHRRYADGIAAAIGERPTRSTGEPAYSDWEEVIRIKAEREDARAVAFHAFVQGAKWWQFAGHGSTAFPSEQDEMVAEAFPSEHAEMVAEAERRYPFAPHPLVMAAAERDEARTLLREVLDAPVSVFDPDGRPFRDCLAQGTLERDKHDPKKDFREGEVLTVKYVTLVQSWCACRHAWEHEKDPVPLHALASSHETLRSQVEVLQRERDEARALLRELLDCKVWDSGLPGCFSLIVPELMYALIEKAVKAEEVKP